MGRIAALAVILLLVPLTSRGDFLPNSPERFLKRLAGVIEARDSAVLMGLYHWERVKGDTRKLIEAEVNELLSLDITSIELTELPPGVTPEIVSNGKLFEMNLEPERMVVVRYAGAEGASMLGLPIGPTPDGYAIGITLESQRPLTRQDDVAFHQAVSDARRRQGMSRGQAPAAPDMAPARVSQASGPEPAVAESAPAPVEARKKSVVSTYDARELQIDISAGPGVVTEIACAYFDTASGERKVGSWRATGSHSQRIPGTEFASCAAKKRTGQGSTRVTLREFGARVFSASTAIVDDAMIYQPE